MESEMLMDEVVRLLRQGCSVTLRVTGKSMCPFLMPTRDKVLLCPALSFRIGDIGRYRDERVCAAQNLRNGYGYLAAYGGWKSVADGSMQPGCSIGQGSEDYP